MCCGEFRKNFQSFQIKSCCLLDVALLTLDVRQIIERISMVRAQSGGKKNYFINLWRKNSFSKYPENAVNRNLFDFTYNLFDGKNVFPPEEFSFALEND